MSRLKNIVKRSKSHKVLIENFSYLAFLQVFLLLYPLITYPYLVDVLGKEIYGIVLTAQMLASYASLFIDFGSNFVCAKHVSINRDNKAKLSEILSNVLFVRLVIFIIFFFIYSFVAYIVPSYRSKFLIFILTYAFCTNDLLFPQFFFQGLERMKIITIVNVTTKVVMVMLIFVIVKKQEDAFLVPIIYSFGYFVGGFISLYLIVFKMKIKLVCPNLKSSILYIKDSSSIFATDIICAIKDKLSYLLVGTFVGMSDVVIYDLGLKLHGIVAKPYMLICTVMFPRLAKNRSIIQFKKIIVFSFILTGVIVIIINIFLHVIILFFLHEECDLLPIRLFLIGPLILSVSYVISNNLFMAFGYNRYMFYSILVTTSVYVICLLLAFLTGNMNTIMTFITISLVSYSSELIYRVWKMRFIINKEII